MRFARFLRLRPRVSGCVSRRLFGQVNAHAPFSRSCKGWVLHIGRVTQRSIMSQTASRFSPAAPQLCAMNVSDRRCQPLTTMAEGGRGLSSCGTIHQGAGPVSTTTSPAVRSPFAPTSDWFCFHGAGLRNRGRSSLVASLPSPGFRRALPEQTPILRHGLARESICFQARHGAEGHDHGAFVNRESTSQRCY